MRRKQNETPERDSRTRFQNEIPERSSGVSNLVRVRESRSGSGIWCGFKIQSPCLPFSSPAAHSHDRPVTLDPYDAAMRSESAQVKFRSGGTFQADLAGRVDHYFEGSARSRYGGWR